MYYHGASNVANQWTIFTSLKLNQFKAESLNQGEAMQNRATIGKTFYLWEVFGDRCSDGGVVIFLVGFGQSLYWCHHMVHMQLWVCEDGSVSCPGYVNTFHPVDHEPDHEKVVETSMIPIPNQFRLWP